MNIIFLRSILICFAVFALSWLLYTGHTLAAAAVTMALVIGVEPFHEGCTARSKTIRRLIQFVCAVVCFCLSANIIHADENALSVIVPFVFTISSGLIVNHTVRSHRTIIDDLRDGSDR